MQVSSHYKARLVDVIRDLDPRMIIHWLLIDKRNSVEELMRSDWVINNAAASGGYHWEAGFLYHGNIKVGELENILTRG